MQIQMSGKNVFKLAAPLSREKNRPKAFFDSGKIISSVKVDEKSICAHSNSNLINSFFKLVLVDTHKSRCSRGDLADFT